MSLLGCVGGMLDGVLGPNPPFPRIPQTGAPIEPKSDWLAQAFMSIDKDYNLREAKEQYDPKKPPKHQAAASLGILAADLTLVQ